MTDNKFLFGLIITAILLNCVPVAADYTLDIFGNANEDDTIDVKDVEYTASVVFGLNDQTQLTDAKYDGEIDILDMTQIELIILGREKELTLIDADNRIVTLNIPIERIASSSMIQDIRTICALGAADKIVGVPNAITGDGADKYLAIYMVYPELTELPVAGSPYYGAPNLEVIASLKPDLILVSYADADAVQEATGVPTIVTPPSDEVALALKGFKWLKTMGYVLNEQERAEELSSYFNNKLNEVTEITSNTPDDEKPKVYLAFWGKLTFTPSFYGSVDEAGGILAADGGEPGPYSAHMWEVSKEQILTWNPDIILLHAATKSQFSIEDVLSDPDLKSIPAVANKKVYYTKAFHFGWDPATGVIEASCYMPKLFYPEEFAGSDVDKEGNEILEEVYGADGIWTAMTKQFDLYTWE